MKKPKKTEPKEAPKREEPKEWHCEGCGGYNDLALASCDYCGEPRP